jgi:hypothetical protein
MVMAEQPGLFHQSVVDPFISPLGCLRSFHHPFAPLIKLVAMTELIIEPSHHKLDRYRGQNSAQLHGHWNQISQEAREFLDDHAPFIRAAEESRVVELPGPVVEEYASLG